MKQKAHRLFLIILINSLIGINLIAQSNYYVLHGDTITQHKVLLQKPYMNAQWCPVYDTSEIVRYSPSEVSAYMTEKPCLYQLKLTYMVSVNKFFLNCLLRAVSGFMFIAQILKLLYSSKIWSFVRFS